MNHTEFKEYMFNPDIKGKTFHLYKHGLIITTPVMDVDTYYGDDGLEIFISGGKLTIYNTNRIIKCRRPSQLIIECENCYQLSNEHNEPIGYIYNKITK
jgi:hypothetical protein